MSAHHESAFPQPCTSDGYASNNHYYAEAGGGMTLRDYFAAKAMQGIFASAPWSDVAKDQDVAKYAYSAADAMMEVRKK